MQDRLDLAALTDLLTHHLRHRHQGDTLICGLSGAQGAGKSTLAEQMTARLSQDGLTCLTLALDDFYLSKAARQKLAEQVHPLCITRGVPGTHDVARLKDTLAALKAGTPVRLPRFDKTSDDVAADEDVMHTAPGIVVLEGWCVGATAAMLAATPDTAWEKAHDPQAIWKGWSRQAAQDYEPVWAVCEMLVQLRQSDFDEVIDARWLQEQSNAARSGRWQFKDRAAVADFCAHYESWTKALWRDLPSRADIVIDRVADFTYQPDLSPVDPTVDLPANSTIKTR